MKNKTYLMDQPGRQAYLSMLWDTTEDDFLMGKAPINLDDTWDEEE